MLNSFPQRAANTELLLRTYDDAMRTYPDNVVIDAAHRFTVGEIDGQSKTFAPSVAEFATAVRGISELRRAQQIDRGVEIQNEPIMAKRARIEREFANRKVVCEVDNHRDFTDMVRRGKVPFGCEYVAILGKAFAPKATKQQEAAE